MYNKAMRDKFIKTAESHLKTQLSNGIEGPLEYEEFPDMKFYVKTAVSMVDEELLARYALDQDGVSVIVANLICRLCDEKVTAYSRQVILNH